MSLRHPKILKASLYILVSICLLLIISIISLKLLLPNIIKSSLNSISESKGVDIQVSDAKYKINKGVKLNDLILRDKNKKSFEIKEVYIKPAYLSSIQNSKIVFKSVGLNEPNVDVSKESIEIITKLISSSEEAKKETDSTFHIKKIDIENLTIQVNENTNLNFSDFNIDWLEHDKNNLEFKLKGKYLSELDENSLLKGNINFNKNQKKINVDLNVEQLDNAFNSKYVELPKNLNSNSKLEINYKDDISSEGLISFFQPETAKLGDINYNFNYNSNSDELLFNKFEILFPNFLISNTTGNIANFKSDRIFNITSNLYIENLSPLSNWLAFLDSDNLKGTFKTENITLIGSNSLDNLNLVANGRIENLNFKQKNNSIEKLNSKFLFKSNLNNENKLITSLNAENIEVQINNDISLNIAEISSEKPIESEIYKNVNNNIVFDGLDITLNNLKHKLFEIQTLKTRNFIANLFSDNHFEINTDLEGSNFEAKGFNVVNALANATMKKNNNETKLSGNIQLNDGSFKVIELSEFKSTFDIVGRKVNLKNSNLKSNYLENANSELITIQIPKKDDPLIDIQIEKTSISTFSNKLISNINSVELDIDKSSTDIEGFSSINYLSYQNQTTNNLKFNLGLTSNKLNLTNISSDFLNGNLIGSIFLDLNGDSKKLKSNLELLNPIFNTHLSDFPIERLKLNFDGLIKKRNVTGNSKINLKNLNIKNDIYTSKLNSDVDLKIDDETIYIKNGFISSETSQKIRFDGKVESYNTNNKSVSLNFERSELAIIKELLYPYLPFEIQEGDVSGSFESSFNLNQSEMGNSWEGKVSINDASLDTLVSFTEFSIKDIDGSFTLDNKSVSKNSLASILGKDLKLNKKVHKKYESNLNNNRNITSESDYLKIREINYGFLKFKNIETLFEMNTNKININYFKTDIYDGQILSAGTLNIKKKEYNMSLLFNDLSLKKISESIPSIEGYITGRFDGLMWLNAGKNLGTVNSLFSFWVKKSDNEKMRIGRALLEKIGATGRFFTGSSRRYDKGIISGYIKEGFITFKKLEITNRIFGYKDLKILVDKKKNSISLRQMISVINEISKRASEGGIEVEFN